MTGAMRKMGVYLGLVEEDLHDDFEVQDAAARDRSEQRAGNAARPVRTHRDDRYDYDDDAPVDPLPAERIARAVESTPRITRRPSGGTYAAGHVDELPSAAPAGPHRITTLHPRTYNEARALGEQFRDGNPVIMNLTEMDDADAKRLVDFAAGLTFGLRGSIERVTAKVFLLSPQKVKVTAEDKARIADGRYPVRG